MRAIIQRVSSASISIDGAITSRIQNGLAVLLGIHHDDSDTHIQWMANKILGLRIFNDDTDQMNLNVTQCKGEILIVSQFTLYGDCRKGRRPSYAMAASPKHAEPIYDAFVTCISSLYPHVQTGTFAAKMQLSLCNEGPVTLQLEC